MTFRSNPTLAEREKILQDLIKKLQQQVDALTERVLALEHTHVCAVCQKRYQTAFGLDLHFRTEHSDPGLVLTFTQEPNQLTKDLPVVSTWRCECGAVFIGSEALDDHRLIMHPELYLKPQQNSALPPNKCPYCQGQFMTKADLQSHISFFHNAHATVRPVD